VKIVKKLKGRPKVEQSLVWILVVVANIQVKKKYLKADAGEGFHVNMIWTWVSRT